MDNDTFSYASSLKGAFFSVNEMEIDKTEVNYAGSP
jgi:hypothetical protein